MSKVKLIDFWAPWCGPCKIMDPVLKEIEEELGERLEIQKVNADEDPDTTAKYGVMGLPTFVIEKDGDEVGRKVGVTAKAELVALINS